MSEAHNVTQANVPVPKKHYALDGIMTVQELMDKVFTLSRRVEELERAITKYVTIHDARGHDENEHESPGMRYGIEKLCEAYAELAALAAKGVSK